MSTTATIINDGNVTIKTVAKDSLANGIVNESAVMHRSLKITPSQVTSAKGNYLTLTNGQKIFDATGGAAVACIGHGNERVRDAVMEQMNKVSYCHSLTFATSAAEDLAKCLIDSTEGEMQRAFFVSSGSEAMEAALKLARQFHLEKASPEPSRTHFIARQQSYHGTTLGALGVGGHVARRALFEPIISSNTSRVGPCYAYRGRHAGESDEAYVQRFEEELEAEFRRVGPKNVAAFIAEPVVGAALGCVPSIPGYFAAVRKICDRHGALLILDEVMSGVGRVGPRPSTKYPNPIHAWQDESVGVTPDLMTLGKGLGGGYMPIAAMLANKKVVDVLSKGTGAFSHGQTYQAHPVACRAALEVQEVIAEENLVENVREMGSLMEELLKQGLSGCEFVGDVRGQGLFWGIEFVKDKSTKEPFAVEEAVAMGVHELGMQEPFNISLYPGSGSVDGKTGDHVLLAPAYNVNEEDIRHIVETTVNVVKTFFERQFTATK